MLEKEIAKLYGTLQFKADYRPLLNVKKALLETEQLIKGLRSSSAKAINIKVKIDSASLKRQLRDAADAKITFRNFDTNQTALKAAQEKMAGLLGSTRIKLSNVTFNMADAKAQKALLRSMLSATTIDLPVTVKTAPAMKSLRAWKLQTEQKLKLHLEADISMQKFYRNVRRSVDAVIARIGTVKIHTPQIQLKVDRNQLRSEIQQVLATISREAKLRIDLTGNLRGGANRASNARSIGHAAGGAGVGAAAAHWGRGFVPGLGGAFAVSQLNQINQQMQGQNNALTAVTGSEAMGQDTKSRFKRMADEIGFDYRDTMPSFTKMIASGKGAGMKQDDVENIFRSMTEYGRVMGLDGESMKGSLRAVEQMLNKGQIMSEELKLQLGERFPAAISLMADAVSMDKYGERGKVTPAQLQDLMKKGLVKSDVLIEFSKILHEQAMAGGALAKAMQSTAAQQARFNNKFSDAVEIFAKAGFDEGMASFFKGLADSIDRATPLIQAFGRAFLVMIAPVDAFIRLLGRLGAHYDQLANWLGVASDKMTSFGLIAIAQITPLGRIVSLISLAAIAFEDFVGYLEGADSVFGDFMDSLSTEKQEQIKAMGEEIKSLAASLKEVVGIGTLGMEKLFGFFGEGGGAGFVISTISTLAATINDLVTALKALSDGDTARAAAAADNMAAERSLWSFFRGDQSVGDYLTSLATPRGPGAPAESLRTKERKQAEGLMEGVDTTGGGTGMNPTFTGPITLQFPNVTEANPTDIEMAVNAVLGKTIGKLSANQKEVE